MSLSLLEQTAAPAVEPAAPVARQWDALAVALLAVLVSAAGAAHPSLWFDEAATISAGTRPLPELWRMLANIDAVHGLYYLVMHGWFAVFPATEFATRLSSCVAVGLAAAGVVVLGRQISTRTVAVTAGLIFAVLPRVTWAGTEARSYAWTMAAAVWLTVLCVLAARRAQTRWWVLYGMLLAVASVLNVFLILMVLVHAVVVVAFGRTTGLLRAWSLACAGAGAAVSPFLLFAQGQLFQVHWISPPGTHTVTQIARDQYFDRALPFALLAAALIVAGLIRLARHGDAAGEQPWRVVATTVAWIVLPTAALLVYSSVRQPLYYPRYLTFTAPAIALLLGLCLTSVARSRTTLAAILVLSVAAAVPNYLSQRGPYAKERMDYSRVADVIDRHAAAGDCLVMDNSTTWKPGPIRPMLAARPAAFEKLHDYGRGRSARERNMLWDAHVAVWAWADRMPDCPALWTITERDPALPDRQRGPALPAGPRLAGAMAYQVPSRFGFRVVERWQFSFAQVTKSVRPAGVHGAGLRSPG